MSAPLHVVSSLLVPALRPPPRRIAGCAFSLADGPGWSGPVCWLRDRRPTPEGGESATVIRTWWPSGLVVGSVSVAAGEDLAAAACRAAERHDAWSRSRRGRSRG